MVAGLSLKAMGPPKSGNGGNAPKGSQQYRVIDCDQLILRLILSSQKLNVMRRIHHILE